MPNPTFFNLAQDKQQVLIDAAKKEFSRVPLNDALISNIVKSAEISRGSFYQYFEDKEDVFYFLLEEHAKENKDRFKALLIETNGDLFETYIKMFRAMLEKFKEEENRGFFKNAFLNMNHKVENTFTKSFNEERFQKDVRDLGSLINMDLLNVENDDEFIHVMQILRVVTIRNIIKSFAKNLSTDESMSNYKTEITILQKGFKK